MGPQKRCFWYNEDGRPYVRADGGRGCSRQSKGSCSFAHPSDRLEWTTAIPSGKPPPQLLASEKYQPGSSRPRSRSPPPSSSTSRRSRSRERRHGLRTDDKHRVAWPPSPGPSVRAARHPLSPARPRESSRSRERPPGGPRRGEEPQLFDLDVRRSRAGYRGRSAESHTSRAHVSHADVDARGREVTSREYKESNANAVPSTPKPEEHSPVVAREPSMQSQSTFVPLPPPGTPPPLPFETPAWVPFPQPTTEPSNMPSSKALSAEGKRKLWTERIGLLTAAANARAEYLRLDTEARDCTRLAQSSRFSALADEDRERAQAHVRDLRTKRDKKEEELKGILSRLAATDFWSSRDIKGSTAPTNTLKELGAQIRDLKDSVSHLSTLLHSISARGQAPVAPPQDETAMEVDPHPNQRHQLLGEFLDKEAVKRQWPESEGVVRSGELEEANETLSRFEDRLADLQSRFDMHQTDMLEDLEMLVKENIQALGAEEPQPQTVEPATLTPSTEQAERLKALEQDMALTGEQVGELAQEVGSLILETASVRRENAALQSENETLRTLVTELQARQKERLGAMEREMRALNAAMQVQLSRAPPEPPLQPRDVEELLRTVRPLLLQSVREEMQPLARELQETVQEMLRTQSAQVSSTIVPKLTRTLQMVEAVQGWLDRMGGVHVVDAHSQPNGAH
ncbi:hypothetical protein AcW1_001830 [Taiwanofungus camphoratus]|nr:hypothetical protein AcW1_001830 [Antrodia cinnamomea]